MPWEVSGIDPINLLLVVGLSSFILMEAYWKAEEEPEYNYEYYAVLCSTYMNNLDRNVNWATFSALARRRSRLFQRPSSSWSWSLVTS